VTFAIETGCKDLRTMLAEANARGLELPVIERALAAFEEATRNGWGGRDVSNMPVYWAQRGGR
jgi:3-hydroxyisobutyrate dehydrogenase